MNSEGASKRQPLEVISVPRLDKPSHVGTTHRLSVWTNWLPPTVVDVIDRFGTALQKVAKVPRFERFWTEKIANDPRVLVVPTFNKKIGKHPIWNVAINWIRTNAPAGAVIEFGCSNGGGPKYFVNCLPATIHLCCFDRSERLPEAWNGSSTGSIRIRGSGGVLG
jgi:hypothetical protein